MRRRDNADPLLSPRILQLTGLALLIGTALFWGATGRESALLVGAALSLIGLGSYERAAAQLRDRLTTNSAEGGRGQ